MPAGSLKHHCHCTEASCPSSCSFSHRLTPGHPLLRPVLSNPVFADFHLRVCIPKIQLAIQATSASQKSNWQFRPRLWIRVPPPVSRARCLSFTPSQLPAATHTSSLSGQPLPTHSAAYRAPTNPTGSERMAPPPRSLS